MKVESIAECFLWGILQYFWPGLPVSHNLSWKPFFCLFDGGCYYTQVLLYETSIYQNHTQMADKFGFFLNLIDLKNMKHDKNYIFSEKWLLFES